MYKTTPHSTTGVSPPELMFSRKLRTRLPGLEQNTEGDLELRDRDSEAKEKGKVYIEQNRKAKTTEIKEGDQVLLKQNALSKMTPPFEPQPYRVVSKGGSNVTVKSPSCVQYNRNSSYLINGSKPLGESQEVLSGDVCTRPFILRRMPTR